MSFGEKLVFFDLETAGLKRSSAIIQIAAVAVDSQLRELETFEVKVRFDQRHASTEALKLNTDRSIRDGLAYIKKIFAVNKNGGHDSCFRAACKLCEAGMTELEVFAALLEWNRTNAINHDGTPCPFTHKELMHKHRMRLRNIWQQRIR